MNGMRGRIGGRIRKKVQNIMPRPRSVSIEELVPPPDGTVYLEPKSGCLVMSLRTFDEIKNKRRSEESDG